MQLLLLLGQHASDVTLASARRSTIVVAVVVVNVDGTIAVVVDVERARALDGVEHARVVGAAHAVDVAQAAVDDADVGASVAVLVVGLRVDLAVAVLVKLHLPARTLRRRRGGSRD